MSVCIYYFLTNSNGRGLSWKAMATGVNSSLQEESDQTDRQIDREEDINEEKEWGARGKRVFAR